MMNSSCYFSCWSCVSVSPMSRLLSFLLLLGSLTCPLSGHVVWKNRELIFCFVIICIFGRLPKY